jgi:hypothetical protein
MQQQAAALCPVVVIKMLKCAPLYSYFLLSQFGIVASFETTGNL